MHKNFFENLAVEQNTENLTRIKILARIKANNLKGAQQLAKPYLQKIAISKLERNSIPSGWIKISQLLCALDIEQNGITQAAIQPEKPDARAWINTALEIIVKRFKGIKKSLVPASLAIALVALTGQILQPINASAQNPRHSANPPDQILLSIQQTTAIGNLLVKSLSVLTEKNEHTKPELQWALIGRGRGLRPQGEPPKIIASTILEENKLVQQLSWSLGAIRLDPGSDKLEVDLIAKNSSNKPATIMSFSLGEANYKGCSLELSDSTTNKYGEHTSPTEIPAQTIAVYKISTTEQSLPTIILKTTDGETHSLLIKLPNLKDLKSQSEKKHWATYRAQNNSLLDIEIKPEVHEKSYIENIRVENKKGSTEFKMEDKPTLYPNNTMDITVVTSIDLDTTLNITTSSRVGTKQYNLSNTSPTTIDERFIKSYKKLIAMLFPIQPEFISWEDIKTQYDKERTALVEFSDDLTSIPTGGKIIASFVQKTIEDEWKSTKEATHKEKKEKQKYVKPTNVVMANNM